LKILIIRLSAIGDTVHCLPVAAAIKRAIPGAQVAWLVEPASAPLLINNPAVDRVFVLPKKRWTNGLTRPWLWPKLLTEALAFWSEIRASQFDVALDLQGLLKSAVCALWSGAKRRIGFAHTREGAEKLLTDRLDAGDCFALDRHVVDLNLRLVRYLLSLPGIAQPEPATASVPAVEAQPPAEPGAGAGPAPPAQLEDRQLTAEFPLPPPPAESVQKISRALGLPEDREPTPNVSMVRNVVLIPGTTWSSKIWPTESWCQLAELIAGMSFRVILVGAAGEAEGNARIASWLYRQCPGAMVLDLTEKTDLLDLIALFQRSDLVVGADTGPLHLAAAVGRPRIVGIYGSTPTGRNGPYGPQCRTVSLGLWCQPCFEKVCPLSTTACLKELTSRRVVAEIQAHLGLAAAQ